MEKFEDISGLLDRIAHLNPDVTSSLPERIELSQGIRTAIEGNISYQVEFGEQSIFSFLSSNLSDHFDANLAEATLWAWVRLCRQEILQKSTKNEKNCETSVQFSEILVNLVSNNAQNESIGYLGSILFMILCSDSEERQLHFGKAGAPAAVVKVLQSHAHNPQVMEFALRAARNLSAHDEVASLFIQEGLGEELNLLLQNPEQPENVLDAIIFVIINLSSDLEIAKILGFYGCTSSLVEVIPRMMQSETVINTLIWALRNLTSTHNNIAVIMNTPICDYLVQILTLHRDDPDTIQSAVWVIANLSTVIGNVRKFLALQLLSHFQEVHDYGLSHYQEDITFGPIAEAIVFAIYNSASAAEDLIAPRETEGEGAEGQGEGEDASKNQKPSAAEEEGRQEAFAIKQALGATGACRLIVQYLSRFPTREAMIEACSRAIAKLTSHCSDNQTIFAQLETVPKLLHAQQCNEDVVETIFLTWRAILSLIEGNVTNLDQFQRQSTEAIRQIHQAMKGFRHFEEINTVGCQLLIYSGYYPAAKLEELVAEGFIDAQHKLRQEIDFEALRAKLGVEVAAEEAEGEEGGRKEDDEEEILIQQLKANFAHQFEK